MRLRRALAAPAVIAVMFLAACGDATVEEPTPAEPTATAEPTEDPTGQPTDDPTEEPTDEPTGDGELPGEVVESHPFEGGGLGVVGVEADDVLHLRSGPGVDFDSIAQLEPLTTGIVATGHNRQLDDGSFWAQVEADGQSGWASPTYLAYPADTIDVTAGLSELPTAATVEEAALAVAEQRMDTDLPSVRSAVVDGPREGDLHEVTLDLLGFADDSILGERLHVFAVQDGAGVTVRTVEATPLCARGVSEGLCI